MQGCQDWSDFWLSDFIGAIDSDNVKYWEIDWRLVLSNEVKKEVFWEFVCCCNNNMKSMGFVEMEFLKEVTHLGGMSTWTQHNDYFFVLLWLEAPVSKASNYPHRYQESYQNNSNDNQREICWDWVDVASKLPHYDKKRSFVELLTNILKNLPHWVRVSRLINDGYSQK